MDNHIDRMEMTLFGIALSFIVLSVLNCLFSIPPHKIAVCSVSAFLLPFLN